MYSSRLPSKFSELAIEVVSVASMLRLLRDLDNIAYSLGGRLALWALSLTFFIASLAVVGEDIDTRMNMKERNPKIDVHVHRQLMSVIAVGVHIYRVPIDGSLAWFHDFAWWLWAGYLAAKK